MHHFCIIDNWLCNPITENLISYTIPEQLATAVGVKKLLNGSRSSVKALGLQGL